MAIEFIQFSAATATTGAIVAADRIDFSGGATDVSVQVIKFGYGTDGVYNEVATGQGLPVATGAVYAIQQMASATSPVSILSAVPLGVSATIPVSVSSAATLPVVVATGTQVYLIQQMTTSTSPVSVGTWTATGAVNVSSAATQAVTITNTGLPSTATIAVLVQNTATVVVSALPSTATLPVTIVNTGLPSTATIAVTITGGSSAGQQYAESVTATASATGFIGNIMLGEDSDDTLQIIKTDATGNLLFSALSSATLPISIANVATVNVANTATVQLATGTRVYLIQQMTTSTSPVSVGTWTATGAVNVSSAATFSVAVSTAATQAVTITNTATVAISGNINANVGGRWAHDATSTGNPTYLAAISEETYPSGVSADGDVTQLIADRHGRLIVMPFGSRQNRVKYHITASATTVVTLATGGAAGVFRDLVSLVAFNSATSEARVRVRSSSTSTEFIWNLAADGGGISFNPTVPWPQAIAATTWDMTLTNALTGTDALTIAAMFLETT